jgi:hypothetical protein
MNGVQVRRIFALALLGVSLTGLVWGVWPVRAAQQRVEYAAPAQGKLGAGAYVMELHSPIVLRVGDEADAWLDLTQHGLPPGVVGVARLELPGVAHIPGGETSRPLSSSAPARFVYSLRAVQPGVYQGAFWVHRIWLGEAGGGQPLAAVPVKLRAARFLGLSGPWARAMGAAGAIIGALFSADVWPAGYRRFARSSQGRARG